MKKVFEQFLKLVVVKMFLSLNFSSLNVHVPKKYPRAISIWTRKGKRRQNKIKFSLKKEWNRRENPQNEAKICYENQLNKDRYQKHHQAAIFCVFSGII